MFSYYFSLIPVDIIIIYDHTIYALFIRNLRSGCKFFIWL